MTRNELLQRLQAIRDRGSLALRLLEPHPLTPEREAEVRSHVVWLRAELQAEFLRTSPERAQKAMTLFELSVYAPTIEEALKHSGIGRLKVESSPTPKWGDALESVVYTADKYVA